MRDNHTLKSNQEMFLESEEKRRALLSPIHVMNGGWDVSLSLCGLVWSLDNFILSSSTFSYSLLFFPSLLIHLSNILKLSFPCIQSIYNLFHLLVGKFRFDSHVLISKFCVFLVLHVFACHYVIQKLTHPNSKIRA